MEGRRRRKERGEDEGALGWRRRGRRRRNERKCKKKGEEGRGSFETAAVRGETN